MRLSKDQKLAALHYLEILGIDLQPELFRTDDDHRIAKTVKQFLTTFRCLQLNGQIAVRRIDRVCDDILAKPRRSPRLPRRQAN